MSADTDETAVVAANQAFYDAFSALDLDRMEAVWSARPSDVCIHPGWDIHRGWLTIKESWRAIFAGTGYMRFEVTEAAVQIQGDVAQVTCIENIYAVNGPVTHHSKVACTNLFARLEGAWRLTLHHGSPIATTVSHEPLQDDALN